MNQGEPQGERPSTAGLGRRRFLTGAAATAALVAAGCSDGSSGSDGGSGTTATTGGGGAGGTAPITPTTTNVVELAEDPFTLGVASGDPLADAVILWTRLAPEPLADDGAGGMPGEPVDVIWEMATDAGFAAMVATGVATAQADHGHAVHVDATGLEPGTDYHYRFRVGEHTSATGRTRTLASGSPDRFSLAVVNCQMFETGAYAAYRHLVDEDVDVVAHLGDYIYEYPGGEGEGRHSAPNRVVSDLTDFRLRYASYKADPDLLAAHARFPFFVTWDDHEVANNYMGDTVPGSATAERVRARRAAAYQAWWEHLPVRLDPPVDGALAVYRSLAVGDLARLHLLDERQDAAVPPCRGPQNDGLDYGDCAEVEEVDRTRLGAAQEAWLEQGLGDGGVTWNLLGNPVVLAGVDAGTETAAYYLDTWDGYPQARRRLVDQLAAASNPVVLTGDYHAGMVLDVHQRPFEADSPVVAPEFMAPPISSVLFDADVTARTPQLRQQINAHGYLLVAVTPDQLTATFRVLDDVTDPETAVRTEATWLVDAGDPVARPA